MVRQADTLAERLTSCAANDRDRIGQAYQLMFGRSVTEPEARLGLEFLGGDGAERAARWSQYAQALLASNEMLMLD